MSTTKNRWKEGFKFTDYTLQISDYALQISHKWNKMDKTKTMRIKIDKNKDDERRVERRAGRFREKEACTTTKRRVERRGAGAKTRRRVQRRGGEKILRHYLIK